jgi:NADH-quinone oxidoreductase subunit G
MDGNGNNMVTLTINGMEVTVRAGTLLTDAAEQAGFKIPQFCAHRWLEPLGACRMCLVRIEKMPKLQTACSTVAQNGMVVTTESDEIKAAREAMLEFHLLNHPLECPVCDRGGECDLQDLTELHGCTTSRYVEDKMVRPDAMLTPYLHMNYKRCILCKRCVRYCEEITGSNLLKVNERGAWSHISNFGGGAKDYFSGNTIEICPVGAITSEVFRFRGRAWELTKTRTVCNQCSVGCAVEMHTRLGELMRVVPAPHSEVNDGHICDRGRFAYGYANNLPFKQPLKGKGGERREVSWEEAERTAAEMIHQVSEKHGANALGLIAGSGLTNEDYVAFRLIAHSHLGTENFFIGEGLIDVSANPLVLLHSLFFDSASISEILQSDLILAVGCDLVEEVPVLALRIKQALKNTSQKLIGLCAHEPRGYWDPQEHYCYEAGNFLAAAGEIIQAIDSGETGGQWGGLVESLQKARTVAIVYGQDLLRHRYADRCLLALLKIKQAMYRWREAGGIERGHISLNPSLRSANATGALVMNNLEFLVNDEAKLPARPHATMRGLLEKAVAGEIKLLYLNGINPLMTFVDRSLVERALEAVDFLIVQDVLPNETTERADLVLPVSPWPCREGTYINFGWRLQKLHASDLVSNLPTDLEVWNRLLIKLGKGSHSISPARIFDEIARLVPAISHLTFDTIPEAGSVLGFQLDDEGARRVAEEVAKVQLDLTRYKRPEDYPLVLVQKLYLFRNSPRMRYSPKMDAATPEAVALMNPEDLSALGLADGAKAVIESRHGSIELALEGAAWVQRGSVIINNYLPEAPTNWLVSVDDEITFVRVRAAQ